MQDEIKKSLRQGLTYIALAVVAVAAYAFVINMLMPQSEFDVAILEKTVELLEEEANWSKMDDRTCGPEDEGLSLYCALRLASIEVTGEFKHRAASLQEVRYAIERRNPDVEYAHRLMDYNNDDFTTFPEMHAMLQEALIMLEKKERPAD